MDDLLKLTRRVRRLELLAWVLLVGSAAATLAAYGPPQPQAIRGERFEMVDAEGHVRGYWRITDDGSAAFTLYDGEGRPRVALAASPSGASEVTVRNAEGVPLRMRIEADGRTPYVEVPAR